MNRIQEGLVKNEGLTDDILALYDELAGVSTNIKYSFKSANLYVFNDKHLTDPWSISHTLPDLIDHAPRDARGMYLQQMNATIFRLILDMDLALRKPYYVLSRLLDDLTDKTINPFNYMAATTEVFMGIDIISDEDKYILSSKILRPTIDMCQSGTLDAAGLLELRNTFNAYFRDRIDQELMPLATCKCPIANNTRHEIFNKFMTSIRDMPSVTTEKVEIYEDFIVNSRIDFQTESTLIQDVSLKSLEEHYNDFKGYVTSEEEYTRTSETVTTMANVVLDTDVFYTKPFNGVNYIFTLFNNPDVEMATYTLMAYLTVIRGLYIMGDAPELGEYLKNVIVLPYDIKRRDGIKELTSEEGRAMQEAFVKRFQNELNDEMGVVSELSMA